MSSRIELERQLIIDTDSPLRHHSMNQHQLRNSLNGEKAQEEPRKVRMARERKERRLALLKEYEDAKLSRVLERVQAVKSGSYDGFCEEGFSHELRYLRMNKVSLNGTHPDF